MVVVNLYAFEDTVAKTDCTFADAVESIDIGGPTLLRAAAKNHEDVTVVVDPHDYDRVLTALRSESGPSQEDRRALALKVFRHTSHYDHAISTYLSHNVAGGDALLPDTLAIELRKLGAKVDEREDGMTIVPPEQIPRILRGSGLGT